MEQKFCSVFKFNKRMYVAREVKANGPRCMVLPPTELFQGTDRAALENEILSALGDYQLLGRSILASEWEARNAELLSYFGENAVSSFEKKKKEVAIKQQVQPQRFFAIAGNGKVICDSESISDIAEAVFEALGKPSAPPPGSLRA